MKKIFSSDVTLVAVLGGFGVLCASLMAMIVSSHSISSIQYNQRCEILAKYGTLISVVRADGNIYDFESDDDSFEVGDKVIVTFDTNGSKEDVFDDKIVKVVK